MIKSENDLERLCTFQETKHKVIEFKPKRACVENQKNSVLYLGEICFSFAIKVEKS